MNEFINKSIKTKVYNKIVSFRCYLFPFMFACFYDIIWFFLQFSNQTWSSPNNFGPSIPRFGKFRIPRQKPLAKTLTFLNVILIDFNITATASIWERQNVSIDQNNKTGNCLDQVPLSGTSNHYRIWWNNGFQNSIRCNGKQLPDLIAFTENPKLKI